MINAIKGMNDVLPAAAEPFLDSGVWEHIFWTAGRVLGAYGYRGVFLPAVEDTELFARGIGEGTDIVAKEMYTFQDRGARSLTLRPEGTAGAARAFVEHHLAQQQAVHRWWYAGPMYRAERPQKGRYRQFYQVGAELFGAATAAADAELVIMVWDLCQQWGVTGVTPKLNTLGDADSRVRYRDRLSAYLRARHGELCEPCQTRIDTNPLRSLDCKRCGGVIADAPVITESLTDSAAGYFDDVMRMVEAAGVPAVRAPRLVRGLDYYTGVLFEFTTEALGAQDAVLGGGRYDSLVESLGGQPTPATGFAAGIERIALIVADKVLTRGPYGPDLYVIPMGGALTQAMALATDLRKCGRRIEVDVAGGKLKQQMRRADRAQARTALVLGADELSLGSVRLKILATGVEHACELTPEALNSLLVALMK